MRANIIGIGQAAAGDDGVGLAVIEALRKSPPHEVGLFVAPEASALLSLLESQAPVILIDAIVGIEVGEVRLLTPESLESASFAPLSSHGLGVSEALRMAEILSPELSPQVFIIGVGIEAPVTRSYGLSAPVLAAIPKVIAQVLSLLSRL